MVLKYSLTPEAFLSAPRRGAAVPTLDGKLGFFTTSTHTFGEGTKKEVNIIDLSNGDTWTISDDDKLHDINWLPFKDQHALLWLRSADKGETEIVVTPDVGAKANASAESQSYVAGTLPGPVEALKLVSLKDGTLAFACVGLAGEDGELYNEEAAEKKASSGLIYDTLHVREWDSYVKPQKNSIFYSTLVVKDDKWAVDAPLKNALAGTDMEAPDNVYEPEDTEDYYDIGLKGITFAAKDHTLRSADDFGSNNLYFVPLDSFSQASMSKPTKILLRQEHTPGIFSNLRFSPDGDMLCFLHATLERPADVRLHMTFVENPDAQGSTVGTLDVFEFIIQEKWSLVPSGFAFGLSGQSLFIAAGDCGRESLFHVEMKNKAKPLKLTDHGSVSAYYPVLNPPRGKEGVLVSGSSLTEPSWYEMIGIGGHAEDKMIFSIPTKRLDPNFGLSRSQVSEIYFEGDGDYVVQAWVVKPSKFNDDKQYPMVLMIHGGPASAWLDSWHARWNAMVWAEQGYVVVLPNISGSTTFGIEHAARIYGSWGGYPYEDLVSCMEYLKNIPYIDTDRAIAAGGSYGGYMINWINGHALGRRFKATVCHDSVFTTPNITLFSDESSGLADFKGNGFPWANFKELSKWDPSRPELLRNWKHASPTLVIHSDKDYRCAITEGLATFRTLQLMGVPSRFLTFPDENHFVQKPDNSLLWHKTIFDWINKYSGVAAEREKGTASQVTEQLVDLSL